MRSTDSPEASAGNQRDHVISGSTGHGTRQGSGCDPHQRGVATDRGMPKPCNSG